MAKRYLKTPEELIDALQAGKKIEAGDFEYRLVGEVIIAINKTDKSWAVNAGIYSDDIPFIDETEPLNLEVGKFYKTRGGDKAIVLYINDKADAGNWPVLVAIVGKVNCSYSVSKTGGYYSSGRDTVWDIVTPWED